MNLSLLDLDNLDRRGGKEIKVEHYDVIVAGGGLSGVGAAVSAAREGMEVLLVERSGCLGGAISNSLVYPFMKYWETNPEDGSRRYLSAGIFTEMRRRQREKSGNETLDLEPEYLKLALDDMILEAGVSVLFHGTVCAVDTEDRRIRSVDIAAGAGILKVEAGFFIDCTGDGNLFCLAGCDYRLGRESDGLCQPMTTCFRVANVDMEAFSRERDQMQQLYKAYRKEGKLKNPRENILIFPGLGEGILHFNTTRVIRHDPTDVFAVSQAELAGRSQVYEMVRFLKENFKAFAHSMLISVASEIGVRESRKLKGEHILTAEELKNGTKFEDTIALGNYEIDIHNPAGTGTELYYFKPGEYYRIPYRSLVPKEYDNLLVAGRCISADHEAQAAVRIMPICACLGEAAGTAAAIACGTESAARSVDVKLLRRKLAEKGAAID